MQVNDLARQYDITPNGQRFIARITAGTNGQAEIGSQVVIRVVLNWFEELKQRVPAND